MDTASVRERSTHYYKASRRKGTWIRLSIATANRFAKSIVQRRAEGARTRKWLASKLAPKKYGDNVSAQLSGLDGGPIQENLTVENIQQED